ncbi:MAG: hypothetical protein GY953_58280 [bacterium]|nr:hypothetical protein [bacterium]
MTAVAALLLAVAVGYVAVRLFNPVPFRSPGWAKAAFDLSLGAGFGVAITSTLFFVLTVAGAASPTMVLVLELALLAGLVATALLRKAAAKDEPAAQPPRFRYTTLLAVAFAVALVLTVSAHFSEARHSPHGNTDAFSIWNLRAKFLLAEGDLWTRVASPLLGRTHPEYPLLLSSFVARTYLLGGDSASVIPGFGTAMLFFWSLLGLLVSAVARLRGAASAILAGLVLIATSMLVTRSTWQYADIPLSYFCLATLALIVAGQGRTTALVMAGAAAGMAPWTKEEGIAFLVTALACFVALGWRRDGARPALQAGRWLLAGAVPGILLFGGFRLFLAPETTFLAGQTVSEILGHLLEPGRCFAVVSTGLSMAGDLGQWWAHPVAFLIGLGLLLRIDVEERHKASIWFGAATVVLTAVVQCAYFIVLPDDYVGLLPNLLIKMYVQVSPAAVFLAFLALGRPRDTVVETAPPPKKSKHKKGKRR